MFPVDSLHSGRYNVGIGGEYFSRKMNNLNFSSLRGFSKVEAGIFRWFSLYALIGIASIDIDYSKQGNLSDFNGSRDYVLGGGLKLVAPIPESFPLGLFCYGGAMRFKSKGRIKENIEEYYIRFEFDWREFWGGIGTIVRLNKLDFYAGIEEKSLQRIEMIRNDEYVSGFYNVMFLGINMKLPERYFFKIQAKFVGELSFSISISQSSI